MEASYAIDKLLDKNEGAYEIEMIISLDKTNSFSFKLTNRMKEELKYSFDMEKEELSIDRSKSGMTNFSEKFALEVIKAPLAKKNIYKIRLFIDKASSELFINDGELALTNIIFPTEPYNSMEFDGNINVKDISIHKIK